MVRGEVITLQLGTFSNYTASHLWNLQSNCFYYSNDAPFGHEFNHDVFYREGRNLQNKSTFNPRTVLIDLKGSIGACAWPVDQAYDGIVDEEYKFWDGTIQIHKAEPRVSASKSEELEEPDVKPKKPVLQKNTWAGYLQNKYHPKSLIMSNHFDSDNPQQAFDTFNQGETLWQFEGDAFEDRIRWFAEDCDQLSGFNIFLDSSNGFTGFGTKCLEYLSDEFRGKSRLVWSLYDIPKHEGSSVYRCLNAVQCYSGLQELADVVLPLSVTSDGIGRDLKRTTFPMDLSHFTGGARLAVHIDSVLSSFKLKSDSFCDFASFPKVISMAERKFVSSSISLAPGKKFRTESLVPKVSEISNSVSSLLVLRACAELQSASAIKQTNSTASSTLCTSYNHPTRFAVEYFPEFEQNCIVKGFGQVNGLFAIQNSSNICEHFSDLLKRKFNPSKLHRAAVGQDDINEAINAVEAIRELYVK